MKSLSTDDIIIDYLTNHPQHIPVLAEWHQNQWHDISPHLNTAIRISHLSTHHNHAAIPVTLIALDSQHRPIGSASLLDNDMEDRPEYLPWLASVYVTPDFRNLGVASKLISAIIKQAQSLDLTKIYLFTPDQRDFYARRGWKVIEQRHYHGVTVDIMYYPLNEDY